MYNLICCCVSENVNIFFQDTSIPFSINFAMSVECVVNGTAWWVYCKWVHSCIPVYGAP